MFRRCMIGKAVQEATPLVVDTMVSFSHVELLARGENVYRLEKNKTKEEKDLLQDRIDKEDYLIKSLVQFLASSFSHKLERVQDIAVQAEFTATHHPIISEDDPVSVRLLGVIRDKAIDSELSEVVDKVCEKHPFLAHKNVECVERLVRMQCYLAVRKAAQEKAENIHGSV